MEIHNSSHLPQPTTKIIQQQNIIDISANRRTSNYSAENEDDDLTQDDEDYETQDEFDISLPTPRNSNISSTPLNRFGDLNIRSNESSIVIDKAGDSDESQRTDFDENLTEDDDIKDEDNEADGAYDNDSNPNDRINDIETTEAFNESDFIINKPPVFIRNLKKRTLDSTPKLQNKLINLDDKFDTTPCPIQPRKKLKFKKHSGASTILASQLNSVNSKLSNTMSLNTKFKDEENNFNNSGDDTVLESLSSPSRPSSPANIINPLNIISNFSNSNSDLDITSNLCSNSTNLQHQDNLAHTNKAYKSDKLHSYKYHTPITNKNVYMEQSTPIFQSTPLNSPPKGNFKAKYEEYGNELNGFKLLKKKNEKTPPIRKDFLNDSFDIEMNSSIDTPSASNKRLNDPYLLENHYKTPVHNDTQLQTYESYILSWNKFSDEKKLSHIRLPLKYPKQMNINNENVLDFYRSSNLELSGLLKKERIKWHPDKWIGYFQNIKSNESGLSLTDIKDVCQVITSVLEELQG